MRKEIVCGLEALQTEPKGKYGADVLWAQNLTHGEGVIYAVRHWIAGEATEEEIQTSVAREKKFRRYVKQRSGNFRFERLSYEEAVEKEVIGGFDTMKMPSREE